jgi:MFS transporter, ACS family, glucarate transporter
MKRYAVIFFLFVLSMITYIDRVCISTAKDAVARDLQLSDSAMGMVFGSFALGYALAQIPSGMFADRFGPRIALTAVVTLWSALTALTGAAWSLVSLVVIRFLFGVGEAGAFPGSARAIYNWLPVKERGRANGIMFSGARIGAAFSFPLLVWMLGRWDWRMSFVILGGVGVLWALVWFLWFKDHPDVPVVQPADLTETIGLRDVFRSGKMALAMTQYFAGNFTFFLCLSWMLPYLKDQYSLSDVEAASYAMAPLLFGATAQWVAGFVVDGLYKSRYRAWSRRFPAMLGFLMAAIGLVVAAYMETPLAAVAWFTAATFGVEMTISPSWAYCADVAGKSSGSVSGSMNMMGNIGSFVSANAFPWLYGMTGTAVAYFCVAAALNAVAIVCWYHMRSVGTAGAAPLSTAAFHKTI